MDSYNLLPQPRKIKKIAGKFQLTNEYSILIDVEDPQTQLFTAQQLQNSLAQTNFPKPDISIQRRQITKKSAIILKIDPGLVGHQQGYRISMTPQSITIIGNDSPGLFYGVCTLNQLIFQARIKNFDYLTNLDIFDWPDFPARGVMLDISRDKVPTMETLFSLVNLLAGLKINQLQLYTEHTFAYSQHPNVWVEASPITGEEVLLLDSYCRSRFIELVPNQNSFGHMHRWLQLPEYESFGELYQIKDTQWWGTGSFSLCPEDPRSILLIAGLYDELLPLFSSNMINVGCDETFDLGLGRSKTACEEKGKGKVYLDFLRKIYDETKAHRKTMQFWGDIVLQHPELIALLPKDAIALEWGYEANHPFQENTSKFAEAGIPFYVCPGTSSWNTIAGRVKNMKTNIAQAAHFGLMNGAIGLLNTDWGDNGHWQALPISYPGYVVGAAYSWCGKSVNDEGLFDAISTLVFHDSSGATGKLLSDLGNIYQLTSQQPSNASALFHILQSPFEKLTSLEIHPDEIIKLEKAIDEMKQLITKCQIQTVDQDLLIDEFMYTIGLLDHAVKRMKHLSDPNSVSLDKLSEDFQDIYLKFQKQWLSRNRRGGLKDSLARFGYMLNDYSQ